VWNFRNILALVIWTSVALTFALHGYGIIKLPDQIVGAYITILTLVTQFYFRKKPEGEGVEGSKEEGKGGSG